MSLVQSRHRAPPFLITYGTSQKPPFRNTSFITCKAKSSRLRVFAKGARLEFSDNREMSRSCSRTALAFIAFSFLPSLFCQESPAPDVVDSAVYRAFFLEAAHQTVSAHTVSKTGAVMLNGQPAGLIQPKLIQPAIHDALGITDQEGQTVIDASAGCEGDLNTLDNDARALIFESRLLAANEEKPSDVVAARLKELDAKRIQIVLDYVQRMKASLGAERSKIVDDYIRAHANTGTFFPATILKKL
jgi:hypothetical protein